MSFQMSFHSNESSSNTILNWDRSLPQCWRHSRLQVVVHMGVQSTATCSRLQRHKTPIRASDKLQNKRSYAVRVSWALNLTFQHFIIYTNELAKLIYIYIYNHKGWAMYLLCLSIGRSEEEINWGNKYIRNSMLIMWTYNFYNFML